MNGKKIKVRKKDSERAEELLGKTSLLAEWLLRNRYPLIGALAGGVLALVVFLGYQRYVHSQDQSALKVYTEARQLLTTGSDSAPVASAEALDALGRVVEQYPARKITVFAQLDLGRACYGRGEYEKARSWFDAASKQAVKDSLVRFLADYHLALCDRERGQLDQAVVRLEGLAAQVPNMLKREFHWQLGLTYEAVKDLNKALEHYQLAEEAAGGFPAQALLQDRKLAARNALKPAEKS